MSCPDELTLSIHADGELPPAEVQTLRLHLSACAPCRARLQAFDAEAASLGAALREVPLLVPSREAPAAVWAWAGIAAASLAGTAAAIDALRLAPRLPEWLGIDALDPVFALGLLLLEAGLTKLQEGVSPMPSVLSILTMIVLSVAALRLRRARAAALVLLVLVAPVAEATERRFPVKGSNTVLIGPGETIDDTLLVGGDSVVVQGTINGDLLVLGREARVEGTVTGSVLCLAKRLEVSGAVHGDVYTLNETLALRGRVNRSVHAITQYTDLDTGASVARDLFSLSKEARVAGDLGRNLGVTVERAELAGTIGGGARVNANRVQVPDTARIGGDLVANVPHGSHVTLGGSAQIDGATRIVTSPEARGPRRALRRFAEPRFYLWQALWLGAALVSGVLLRRFVPAVFEPRTPTALVALRTVGFGLVALVVTPVVAFLAGLTVIGLPVALVTMAGWLAAIYLASVVASAWLGRLVLRQETTDLRGFLLALLVGQVILRLFQPLPYVGGLTCFAALLLGLGLLVVASRTVAAQLQTR